MKAVAPVSSLSCSRLPAGEVRKSEFAGSRVIFDETADNAAQDPSHPHETEEPHVPVSSSQPRPKLKKLATSVLLQVSAANCAPGCHHAFEITFIVHALSISQT